MKYILCQPAIKRFEWELDVCLTRILKLGIQDIILLFSQWDDVIPQYFEEEYGAEVHVYKDKRKNKNYIPSIKPYLWMRFLEEDPSRENETYFYLDSDVLLKEVPDVNPTENIWYASDCNGYIGLEYIDKKHPQLVESMCEAIEIDAEMIREHNPIGGAQWVIKNPSFAYWKKVYEDSNTLYNMLSRSNTDIQKWTAEMWAQLWNVYHVGKVVKTPSELDFCWPTDDVRRYNETKIYHNAGVINDNQNLFFKGKYVNKTPFHDNFNHVDKSKASIKYVEAIKDVRKGEFHLKYEVLHDFRDLQDKEKIYRKGDTYPKPANKKISDERIEELSTSKNRLKKPLIKEVEEQE